MYSTRSGVKWPTPEQQVKRASRGWSSGVVPKFAADDYQGEDDYGKWVALLHLPRSWSSLARNLQSLWSSIDRSEDISECAIAESIGSVRMIDGIVSKPSLSWLRFYFNPTREAVNSIERVRPAGLEILSALFHNPSWATVWASLGEPAYGDLQLSPCLSGLRVPAFAGSSVWFAPAVSLVRRGRRKLFTLHNAYVTSQGVSPYHVSPLVGSL